MSGVWTAGSFPELCRIVVQVALGAALHSTLLLGLGLLAGHLLRRRGPALRALLYRVTLVGVLAGVLSVFILGQHVRPLWSVTLPSAAPDTARQTTAAGQTASLARDEALSGGATFIDPHRLPAIPALGIRMVSNEPVAPRLSGPVIRSGSPGATRGRLAALPARSGSTGGLPVGWLYVSLVAVWATGTALSLVRLLLCQLQLDGIRRRAVPIHSEEILRLVAELCHSLQVRPPRLLAGPGVNSPFLAGLRQPTILLPAEHERLFDRAAVRLILAHELVHLARRDCVWYLMSRLACALGWAQPLLWALCRRLEQASEEVCDQEVVRLEGNPRVYARCLLTLSEQLLPSLPARALGVGVVAIRSSLGRRIQGILENARHRPLSPTRRLQAAITMAAAAFVVLGLFLASAIAAPPAERVESSKEILRGVRGLEKPVTFTETKIPLGELVQRVAAQTGVSLVAVPEVADEPLSVVVKELQARELLEQVAVLLDYMWSRRSKEGEWRYEIWQDLASKNREAAFRNALRADVIRRFQQEMQRYVELASWTPERLQQFLLDSRRPNRPADPNPNESARRFHTVFGLTAPISRSVAQLLSRLTPEQWATVRDGETLVFSTEPQPGELAMPAATARTLRGAKPTSNPPGAPGIHVTYDDPEGPEQARQIDQSLQEMWAAATGYRVTIQIDPHTWRTRNTLRLTAAARPFRTGAPAGADFFDAHGGTSVKIQTEPLDFWSREEEKPRLSEAELARDPVFGARQLFRPMAKPRRSEFDHEHTPPMHRMRDLLPDLARTYKVQIIADAYTPVHARTAARLSSEPEPLYKLLQRLAFMSHRWDRNGNLIRLRSRTWFLDRPKEIPLRLVRHWKELTDRNGALPLEKYVEMANSLNDLQMENLAYVGEDVELPQSMRMYMVGRSRFGLSLYGALTPAQKQALWNGESLSVAQMTPAQQQLFLANLEERGRYEPGGLRLEKWAGGRLTLRSKPDTVTVNRPGGAAGSKPEQPTARLAAPSAPGSGRPGSQPEQVTHHAVTRLQLQFWYTPEQEDAIDLTVARSSEGTPGS